MKKLLMSLSMALIVVMMTVSSVQPLIAKSIATSDDSSSENGLENNLQKVYCEATVQDSFSNNEIIVVTMPFANFKKYTAEDFSEIGCVSVVEMSSDVKQDMLSRIILLTIERDSKQEVLDCIQKLQDREDIYSAEPNYCVKSDAVPNDIYYNVQWGPEKISLSAAWDITTGSTSVLVGVIDSGIDGTHPDLIGNIDTNLSRCFSSAYTNALQDEDGHGTHVAGIIGAVGNNGIGIAGTCWNVRLVSLKVSYWDEEAQDFKFDGAAVISAINYATQKGIDILNFSGGSYTESSALRIAITNYPGVFVCSAGNDHLNTDLTPHYPSSYDCSNIISVGNSNEDDGITTWLHTEENGTTNSKGSNYGATSVDIFSPGTMIWSCMPHAVWPNDYKNMSGTSMAAPFVSGVVALYLAKNPHASATEIRQMVIAFDDSVNTLRGRSVSNGRLNAYKVLSHNHNCNFSAAGSAKHSGTCAGCGIVIYRPHNFTQAGSRLICTDCGYSSISLNSVPEESGIS